MRPNPAGQSVIVSPGKKQLAEETANWSRLSEAINLVVEEG